MNIYEIIPFRYSLDLSTGEKYNVSEIDFNRIDIPGIREDYESNKEFFRRIPQVPSSIIEDAKTGYLGDFMQFVRKDFLPIYRSFSPSLCKSRKGCFLYKDTSCDISKLKKNLTHCYEFESDKIPDTLNFLITFIIHEMNSGYSPILVANHKLSYTNFGSYRIVHQDHV